MDEISRAKRRSEDTESEEDGAESAQEVAPAQTDTEEPPPPPRKAGKQQGAPGHGRTQQRAVTDTVHHRPGCCETGGSEAQEGHAEACGRWAIIHIQAFRVLAVNGHIEGSARCRRVMEKRKCTLDDLVILGRRGTLIATEQKRALTV
jgi:hypothetical protein